MSERDMRVLKNLADKLPRFPDPEDALDDPAVELELTWREVFALRSLTIGE